MRYILLLLMFVSIQTVVNAETQDTPPAYVLHSSSGLMSGFQGTAVCLRVYKIMGGLLRLVML